MRSVRLHAGRPRESQPDLDSSSERLWQTVWRIWAAIVSIPDQIGADVFSILNSVGKPITIYAPLSPRPSPDGLRAVCEPVPNYAYTYAQINPVADRDRPLYPAVNLPEQVAVTSK